MLLLKKYNYSMLSKCKKVFMSSNSFITIYCIIMKIYYVLIILLVKPKLHLVFHFQSIYHTTRQPEILHYFVISSHLKYNLTFIFNLLAIL